MHAMLLAHDGDEEPALPLHVAELVLCLALRDSIHATRLLRSDTFLHPAQAAILNALGPRTAFRSITDTLIQHVRSVNLTRICNVGDTDLFGRLLDPSVPKGPKRWLYASPCALERASGRGDLDMLGYWFRLAPASPVLRVTPSLVRLALSGAVRGSQWHVVEWLLDAVRPLVTEDQVRQCWLFAYAAAKATCPQFLAAVLPPASSAAVAAVDRACVQDKCLWCTAVPFLDTRRGTVQHFVIALCKQGHVQGFRAVLRRGGAKRQAVRWIPHHALLVASKCGHRGILDAWFQGYKGADLARYRVWEGVGIRWREWLLAHEVGCRVLKEMGLDEVSRAGQIEVMEWWLARFREGKLPTLRFSFKAFDFKSLRSGVKSIQWWVKSGLLRELGPHCAVNVWVYCCKYPGQFTLVEHLVASAVPISFVPVRTPSTSVWPNQDWYDRRVVERIKAWWEKADMRAKTGRETHDCLEHVRQEGVTFARACQWSVVLEHNT